MSETRTVTIQVLLTDEQAWQLAQFYKRSIFEEYLACASTKEEAYTMIAAMDRVAKALAEKGYAPR